MDVCIDRVYDIQKPDQADKQNQPPGQEPDLGPAFLKLTIRLLIGNHGCARNPPAELFQNPVKGLSVRILIEKRTQLGIGLCARKAKIDPVTDEHLNSIHKSAVSHSEIAVITAKGQQHRQLHSGHPDHTSLLHMGRAKGFALDLQREWISHHASLSRFQGLHLLIREPGGKVMVYPWIIETENLKGFPGPQCEIRLHAHRLILCIQLIEGELQWRRFSPA